MNENHNNIQMYEDEIDLRKLILALWKQKIMIICITLIITLFAGLFSRFMISPVYETKMNLVISMPELYQTRYGEYKLPMSSNGDYLKLIKSNDVLVNTIKDMEYDTSVVTPSNLSSRITFGTITTTANTVQNSFEVTVAAGSPEESLELANHLYENYIEFLDVMMKERAVNYYYEDFTVKVKAAENLQATTEEIVKKNEELLANTPQTINQKEAMQEIQDNTSDFIILENIINPNYTELEKIIIDNKQILITTESSIEEYTKYLEELSTEKEAINKYYESGKAGRIESSIMDVVDVNVYQPSVPIAPTHKSSPNTLMNVAIGVVLGGMLGVMIALFIAYWKKEL
jgi:capsular polysaccharide biosynthesis protein